MKFLDWCKVLFCTFLVWSLIVSALLFEYAIEHEFEDNSEWFGQGRKLYDFRNNITPSGNYVYSWDALYCAVARQKQHCQDKFNEVEDD